MVTADDDRRFHEWWSVCCWQLATDLLPYVQSCANPVIYSFMSHSFRRRVRVGWRHCRRCLRRGDDGERTGARSAHYGGPEDHPLEELGADLDAAASRRHVSFGSHSARRWSSMAPTSRNSRRRTGGATHLTVMTGWQPSVWHWFYTSQFSVYGNALS